MYHPRFKGTYYEAGVKYGQLMKKNGVDIMQFAKLPQDQLTFGLLCIKEYERYYPEVLQQITGLADGIGIDSKIFAAWLFCMYCYTNDNWSTTMVLRHGYFVCIVTQTTIGLQRWCLKMKTQR